MYSLRYGTIPVVNAIGGLKDTIIDIKNDGFGICHNTVNVEEVTHAISRATAYFKNKKVFQKNVTKVMKINNSWSNSAQLYVNLYKSLQQTKK